MAKFLTDLDLNLNQLKNVVVEKFASAPAGKTGRVYYDETKKTFGVFDGEAWVYFASLADLASEKQALLDAIDLKADKSYVDDELAKKVNADSYATDKKALEDAIALKVAQSEYDAKVEALEAKDGELAAAIATKVETKTFEDKVAELEAEDAKKVNKTDYETDKKALEDAIALKVAQSEYDAKVEALEKADADEKAAREEVAGDLADYIASNDAAVALKANAADVYTKEETYSAEEIDGMLEALDCLPAQADNAGKFLTTDGTSASWKTIQASDGEFTAGTSTTLVPTVKQTADALALKANDASVVHTSGDEEIAGVKTFTADTIFLPENKVTVADISEGDFVGQLVSKTEDEDMVASLGQAIAQNGNVSSTVLAKNEPKVATVTTLASESGAGASLQVADTDASVAGAIELTLGADNSVSTKLTGAAANISADSNDGQIATTAFVKSHTASAIANKAEKATTLAGYGIADAYTKDEVDAKVASVYRFKGSVETFDALPTEGLVEGDVYNVKATGENYAWVAASGDVEGHWDDLGGDIDLTPYATKEEVAATYETIANVAAKEEAIYDAIEPKADKSYVDEELAKKANSTDVENTYLKKTDAASTYATKEELGQLTDSSVFKAVAFNEELTPADGVATWTIAHILGEDVEVAIKEVATNEVVYADVVLTENLVTIRMNADEAIAANTYKVIILG
jgi:hypothetical protein